jgi:hypothetical protein
MNTDSFSRFSLLKSILILMGTSFFAFLLSGALHETGHYLASTILGVPVRGIVLHPFGQDYNIYLGDLSVALGTPVRRAFEAFSGPFFTVLIGVMVSLLLWRRRVPVLLPLLMVGSTSLLIESVGIILEITDPNPSADWSRVMQSGIPAGILWLLAVVMLIAGCLWMLQLLPLAGIRSQDPLWRKLVVFLAGISVLLLCAVIYQTLFGGDYYVPTWRGYMLMENLRKAKTIQLGVSIVLFTVIAALHKPLFPWLDRLSHTPVAQARWREALIAIGLGLAITIIQLAYFNDPTIVVR